MKMSGTALVVEQLCIAPLRRLTAWATPRASSDIRVYSPSMCGALPTRLNEVNTAISCCPTTSLMSLILSKAHPVFRGGWRGVW